MHKVSSGILLLGETFPVPPVKLQTMLCETFSYQILEKKSLREQFPEMINLGNKIVKVVEKALIKAQALVVPLGIYFNASSFDFKQSRLNS